MTRPRIGSDQRCTCTRSLGSGRHYCGWEACRLCGGFVVRSDAVKRRLEREAKRPVAGGDQAGWREGDEDVSDLTHLPDSTPVYVDGYGPATLGEAREPPEEAPALSDWERTLNMWRDIASLNTSRHPWENRVSVSEIRAYHASRSTDDPPRLAST